MTILFSRNMKNFYQAKNKNFMNNPKSKRDKKRNLKNQVRKKSSKGKRVKKKFWKIFRFQINRLMLKSKKKIWDKMKRPKKKSKLTALMTMKKLK